MSTKCFLFDPRSLSKAGNASNASNADKADKAGKADLRGLPGKQASLPRVAAAQPLSPAQTVQIVGGCSNPHGCLTVDQGVAFVTLRQPPLTDFANSLMSGFIPYRYSQ